MRLKGNGIKSGTIDRINTNPLNGFSGYSWDNCHVIPRWANTVKEMCFDSKGCPVEFIDFWTHSRYLLWHINNNLTDKEIRMLIKYLKGKGVKKVSKTIISISKSIHYGQQEKQKQQEQSIRQSVQSASKIQIQK